jgi:hypothetical protein
MLGIDDRAEHTPTLDGQDDGGYGEEHEQDSRDLPSSIIEKTEAGWAPCWNGLFGNGWVHASLSIDLARSPGGTALQCRSCDQQEYVGIVLMPGFDNDLGTIDHLSSRTYAAAATARKPSAEITTIRSTIRWRLRFQA